MILSRRLHDTVDMLSLDARELPEFPPGDNSSDAIINGHHYSVTTLHNFNYVYYTNDTISNGSDCYVAFGKHQPTLLGNGTWLDATSCYGPVLPISKRGAIAITLAILFFASVVVTLVNIGKHGRIHLPVTKRFSAVGRRWQWYWMSLLAVCGGVSAIMGVDVDRNYLMGLAMVLQTFFFYLMVPALLGAVWEGVRHWGSWQERQMQDADPTAFVAPSTREKQEFYLPLIFYFFAVLNFLLTIPHKWGRLLKQHSPEQAEQIAEPAATDTRFRASSGFAILDLLVIIYSLGHSIYRYRYLPRKNRGDNMGRPWTKVSSFILEAPVKFALCILLVFIRVFYGAVSTSNWDTSPARYGNNTAIFYCLGYLPALLVIAILNMWGLLVDENEDIKLIRQQNARSQMSDVELGIDPRASKPWWWSHAQSNNSGGDPRNDDNNRRLLALVSTTLSNDRRETTNDEPTDGFEMVNLETKK